MPEIAGVAPRRRFGAASVWLAVGAFVTATIALIVMVEIPKTAPAMLRDIAFFIFAAIVAVLAPLAHIAGIILGFIAIFLPGDRRGLGILGVALNAGFVGLGLLLVYLALAGLAGLAGFR